jgi:glucose-1-phosphatase
LPNCSCILLDLGKVLVDFEISRFGDRMRESTGVEPERLRSAVMGNGLSLRYETGLIPSGEFHAEVCRNIGVEIPFSAFAEAWNSIFKPVPILQEDILASLASKADLWILSNTNPLHFDFILERYGFLRQFKGYIVSYRAGAAKPDPAIFQFALRKARSTPAEALFVDDAAANVQAAVQLGLDAFQFLSPDLFAKEMSDRKLL